MIRDLFLQELRQLGVDYNYSINDGKIEITYFQKSRVSLQLLLEKYDLIYNLLKSEDDIIILEFRKEGERTGAPRENY